METGFHLHSVQTAMDVQNMTGQKTGEYIFNYTRVYNNIPESYYQTYWGTTATGVDGGLYRALWEREYVTISVKDNMIIDVRWENPGQIDGVENENVAILSFEEVQPIFLNQLKRLFDLPDYTMTEVKIDRIELGLTKVVIQDSDEYRMIPAWSFYGSMGPRYSCLVTVNAIDGSIVDLGQMY